MVVRHTGLAAVALMQAESHPSRQFVDAEQHGRTAVVPRIRALIATFIALTAFVGPGYAADQDGDGLTDADEIALGLDPFSPDSDCDNRDDAVEVCSRLDAPRDFDNDGRPNALESHFSDADADGLSDAIDPDEAIQIGCGAFRPFAVTSGETSTLTLRVSGSPGKVELLGSGVASMRVDGEPAASIELFDDGTHGDVRSNRWGVYKAGDWSCRWTGWACGLPADRGPGYAWGW